MISSIDSGVLRWDEKIILSLRSLYGRFGYTGYKMSKFEEYDLYAGNKEFLISDNVITFTDTNGRLMALKPDVTLSIIKNGRDGELQKVCYNENVCRAAKNGTFRELMQAGIECIGDIDNCAVGEVLYLAAASLEAIAAEWELDVSSIGVTAALVDEATSDSSVREELIRRIGEKNIHDIKRVCTENGVDDIYSEKLCSLAAVYGCAKDALSVLHEITDGTSASDKTAELEAALGVFDGTDYKNKVKLDFSVVSDVNYYSGIVFKGFAAGIPESVLSGGRYDGLMKRMKRRSGAVGFAVYVDRLERLFDNPDEYDVDVLLVYGDSTPAEVRSECEKISAGGMTVFAAREETGKLRYRIKTVMGGK